MDRKRKISPLKRAKGAYKINSTKLRPDQTANILERIIRKSMKPTQVPTDFAPPKGATGFRRLLKVAFSFPYRIFFFSSFVRNKELKDIKQYRGRPVIFACNHRTNVDVVTFFLMLPKFKLHFIGKESLFKDHSFLNWFLRSLNGIPIRRGKNDIQIIRRSLDILKGGESLAIFPEGRRNFDAESALELQSGTAIISMKSGAPVIPIVTNRAARPFKINRLRVGKVLDPKVFEDRDEFSKAIRDEMVRLLDGFEKKPRLKKRDRIPVFNSRGICFIGEKLLVMKRFKKGQNYFVIPGGHMDAGESAKDAVSRELLEETSVVTVPVRPLYKRPQTTTRGSGMQVFYLCEYKSGEPKKTNAEEYTLTADEEKEYGTFEPTLIDIAEIANVDLRPNSVRDQLLKDLKKYGIHLTRPTIYLK
jgi:1-acyl-sn-glycerol-3-phosphate acyltransferase